MIVSQFRLRADNDADEDTQLVLLVTNLSDDLYSFGLTFHTQYDDFADVTTGWADGENLCLPLWVEPAGSHQFTFEYALPILSKETARVRLYLTDEAGDDGFIRYYGINGHLELTLPTVSEYPYSGSPKAPQGTEPVPVLVHGYMEDHRDSNVRDFHPLSLASGAAQAEITPDQTTLAKAEVPKDLLKVREQIRSRKAELRIAMADRRIGPRLRALLARARRERDLRAIDALLSKAKRGARKTRKR